MGKYNLIAGLDIGSNQICCVAGSCNRDTGIVEIMAGAKIPCRGVKGGVVINLNETARAIEQVVQQVEEKIDDTIRQVYIGIRGNHIESLRNHGAINISRTDKTITTDDVETVIENAKTIRLSPDREILHTIPQEFSLDRQRGVPDPVGMEGSFLEVDVHIVTASSSHLGNIEKAISMAGFEIIEPIYGLLALGHLVVTQEDKELGCLLIDFGGLTTGLSIFMDGSIRYSKELQIGSDLITRDISHSLRTSLSTAQSIKEKYGVSMASLLKDDLKIDYMNVDGRTTRTVSRRHLVEIIQSRLDQILVAIEQELREVNFLDAIMPGGIIITGGGSRLEGIVPAVEQVFDCSARIGLPQDVQGPDEIVLDPTYTTAIGLLKQELITSSIGSFFHSKQPNRQFSFLRKIRGWVEDILNYD